MFKFLDFFIKKEIDVWMKLYLVSMLLMLISMPINIIPTVAFRLTSILFFLIFAYKNGFKNGFLKKKFSIELKLIFVFFILYHLSLIFSTDIKTSIVSYFFDASFFLLFVSIFFSLRYFSEKFDKTQLLDFSEKFVRLILFIIIGLIFLNFIFFLIYNDGNLFSLKRVTGLFWRKYVIYQSSLYSVFVLFLIVFFSRFVSKFEKIVAIFAIFLGFMLIFNGGTRMHLIAFVVSLIFFFLYKVIESKKYKLYGVLLVVLIFIFGIMLNLVKDSKLYNRVQMVPVLVYNFSDLISSNEKYDTNETIRIGFWKASCDAALLNPIVGVGPQAWKNYVHDEKKILSKYIKKRHLYIYNHPHSDFFQMVSEIGIVAVLLFLSIWLIVVSKLFLIFKRSSSFSPVLLFSILVLIFHLVSGLTDRVLFYRWIGPIMWSNLALLFFLIEKQYFEKNN